MFKNLTSYYFGRVNFTNFLSRATNKIMQLLNITRVPFMFL